MNLHIEFVHDIDCSWCPISYANLKTALKMLGEEITPELEFLPYEVKPNFSQKGELIGPRLMALNGWTEAQHEEYRTSLLATAENAGVKIDFSKRTHYYNTEKAHRLLHLASKTNQHVEMNELLIEGYFSQGLNVTSNKQLIALAERIGINAQVVEQTLNAEDKPADLIEKYSRAKQITVQGVPAMRINNREIIKGANTPQFIASIIAKSLVKS